MPIYRHVKIYCWIRLALFLCHLHPVSGGFFGLYSEVVEEQGCSCGCCVTELRRPNERDAQVTHKCTAPPDSDPKSCGQRVCFVVNDPVFFESKLVDYNRYCFYHCTPTSPRTSFMKAKLSFLPRAQVTGGHVVDSPCIDIKGEYLAQAIGNDHNGRDHRAPYK